RFGSVLNGGGAFPHNNKKAKISDWIAMADDFWKASMDKGSSEIAIPIIWGVDAVHGHNNIFGATIFPHNIGLGATRDTDLIRKIGEITAKEIRATGQEWNFGPVVAVVRDDRWGRTYESYGEHPVLVKEMGRALVEGLQGNLGPLNVAATAKHYIGDGSTAFGINTGDNLSSESDLIKIAGAGYFSTIEAGVQSVMISFNSWKGEKIHGHKYLITDVLKGKLGFDGIVISDWNGIGQIKGCTNGNCPQAVNAGIDLFMVTDRNDWKAFYENTLKQSKSGQIPMDRINDAVSRILRVKFRLGLFDQPKPSDRPLSGKAELVGAIEHRELARQAARKSMVLLKNKNGILPLSRKARILVAGKSADRISNQLGGWSLSWQGLGHPNSDFPNSVSMLQAIKKTANSVVFNETAKDVKRGEYDVAIAIIGESPYAESAGDIKGDETLEHSLRYPEDLLVLKNLKAAEIPIVTVFLSGRPLYVNREINMSKAFIAAFLPGSEGAEALTDLIFQTEKGLMNFDFQGKLSFSWPISDCQTPLNFEDAKYEPLFPYGFGLSYLQKDTLIDNLDEFSPNAQNGCNPEIVDREKSAKTVVFYSHGLNKRWKTAISDDAKAPIEIFDDRLELKNIEVEPSDDKEGLQYAAKKITFKGRGSFLVKSDTPQDLSKFEKPDSVISIDLFLNAAASQAIKIKMACEGGCGKEVDITHSLDKIKPLENGWKVVKIPLKCFNGPFAKVKEAVRITS
ncbi:MAG: glycoside hydrolase family 3 C-terminal domain-containing protein, partial [Oligoflexales bacterium]|nr:glycoside hydrolase family 3 C-terminal domain-containing protein [Oligoflexales bacterium]